MGRRGGGGHPDLDGVLVVDKPAGMTSHDVVDVVRRAAGQRKVGHTGTLDPDATGVLVVCLGRATRLVRFLQSGRKTYAARLVLGRETTTQDAAGEIVREVDASHVDERTFCAVLTGFQGAIEQTPPMVSAVKVGGERLHEKARRGEEVERQPRSVTVHDLVLEDYAPGPHPEAGLLVTCSSGTYVRTLAHDIGRALGVGGSLTSLHRLANGSFAVRDAVPVAELESAGRDDVAARMLSLREAVADLAIVEVDGPEAALGLTHGGSLPAQGIPGPYAVVLGDLLVGIFEDRDGQGRPEAVLLRPDEAGAPAPSGTAAPVPGAGGDR